MSNRPNILLIVADQQRYDCLGAYGNSDIQTPHIDALAADGMLYENSFCSHPVCTPSRYSLLTGQYVHQHLGLSNRSTLPAGIPTLPRLLKASGYATTAVGKMHFTPTYLDVGFDQMILAEQNGAGRYEDDYHRWLQAEGLYDRIDLMDQEAEFRKDAPQDYWDTFGAIRSDLDEEHHSTTWIGDRAVEAIDGWQGEGNFLMASFIKPHHPFDPPHPWDSLYDPASLSLLPGWTESLIHADDGKGYFSYADLSELQLRHVMALYYATISQIDHHVGRMTARLKERDLYDNTIIVYTSDHGEFMGYHHRILKGYRMLEALARVPLIIKGGGRKGARGRDQRLVSNVDLAPTLLSAAALPIPASMTGADLTQPGAQSEYVFAESNNEYMIRSRTRKLLLHRDRRQSIFFDLARDPLEMENLIEHEDYQEEVSFLRAELLQWALFHARAHHHLDLDAPLCRAQNVPTERAALYPYFQEKMAQA
jgi:arylsulfatase A-like enzyme